MNQVLSLLFLALLTVLASCGVPPEPMVCVKGTTMGCACTGGKSGVQTCEGDGFGACICDGTPVCKAGSTQACACTDGSKGVQSCTDNKWGTCQCMMSPSFRHGDVCKEPDYECGQRNNLVCVVDQEGDTQGQCRLVCTTFSDCLRSDDARGKFDTNCCKIKNGTRVCGQRKYFPAGACD